MAYRNREEEKLERREEQTRRDTGQEPGERKKRTWKEIDAGRDGTQTGQRRDNDGPRPKGESPAYRAYKSKLGRLFDEGKMPSGVQVETVRGSEKAALLPKVEPITVEMSPKEMLKAAEGQEIEKAARFCVNTGGLPLDAELLAKVLLCNDAELLAAALEALLDTLEKGRPKNYKVLAQRIADCEPHLKDAHALDIAKGIRARLGV